LALYKFICLLACLLAVQKWLSYVIAGCNCCAEFQFQSARLAAICNLWRTSEETACCYWEYGRIRWRRLAFLALVYNNFLTCILQHVLAATCDE